MLAQQCPFQVVEEKHSFLKATHSYFDQAVSSLWIKLEAFSDQGDTL